MTCDQVTDTTAVPLLYEYDDVSDPLAAGDTRGPRRGAEMADEAPVPEMVGATDQPIVLTGKTESASVPVTPPAGPGRARGGAAAPDRVYLNIENITGDGEPTSYAVYVNLPPNADPAEHRDLFAGILPMFGVAEATRADGAHPGSGLQYSLEVSRVVRTLEARNDWNPATVRVTFVPRRRSVASESSRAAGAADPIQVGRVSVYFA
jgi:tyrosinase